MYMLHRDVAPSHVDVARCAILQGDIDLYNSTSGKSSRSIASVDSHASYYDVLGKKTALPYQRGPNERVELFNHSPLNVRAPTHTRLVSQNVSEHRVLVKFPAFRVSFKLFRAPV